MGAMHGGDFESKDISHLASVHFPELRDLPGIDENGGPMVVPDLDFLSFGAGMGDDWRDWPGNNGAAAGAVANGSGGHGDLAAGHGAGDGFDAGLHAFRAEAM